MFASGSDDHTVRVWGVGSVDAQMGTAEAQEEGKVA